MINVTLTYSLPIFTIETKNFSQKKRELKKIFKNYPESRQNKSFSTNKLHTDIKLVTSFSNIIKEEL